MEGGKIRAVIVDDEVKAQKLLAGMLDSLCPEIEVLGVANSVKTAYEMITVGKPDLIFLDIQMPGGSGFDLLEKFDSIFFKIIFVTAFDEFAIRAIRFSAIDYILKPVGSEVLINAVKKVREGHVTHAAAKVLVDNLQAVGGLSRLAIYSVGKVNYIELKDIVRFESEGAYTHVFLNDGQKLLSTRPIKEYEELLHDSHFFRIHRSHLVNLYHVKEYKKGIRDNLLLTGGGRVEVYRKKRSAFLEAMAVFSR